MESALALAFGSVPITTLDQGRPWGKERHRPVGLRLPHRLDLALAGAELLEQLSRAKHNADLQRLILRLPRFIPLRAAALIPPDAVDDELHFIARTPRLYAVDEVVSPVDRIPVHMGDAVAEL